MRPWDGISFNGKHSWRDYRLHLIEPPDFGTPEPKTQTVNIPGMDGVLDFTEAATGEVKYSNRTMKFTFQAVIEPEHRERLRSEIWNDLHEKTAKIIYDFDPEWYYSGRCSVEFDDVQVRTMKVIITVDAKPYKLAVDDTFITVEPTSFAAETVLLGEGTEAQHQNSIFTFGSSARPQLDLTQFSKLTFVWPASSDVPYGTPNLQIVDGSGAHYDGYTGSNTLVDGLPAMDLAISDITGITKTSVYRILCQGRPLVKLYGTTDASASVTVPVDRMSVNPVWYSTASVSATVNGKKFTIPPGRSQIFDVMLKEGDNTVSFVSDSDGETIGIEFRNGRL